MVSLSQIAASEASFPLGVEHQGEPTNRRNPDIHMLSAGGPGGHSIIQLRGGQNCRSGGGSPVRTQGTAGARRTRLEYTYERMAGSQEALHGRRPGRGRRGIRRNAALNASQRSHRQARPGAPFTGSAQGGATAAGSLKREVVLPMVSLALANLLCAEVLLEYFEILRVK